jgi:hypothetical protein
LSDVLKKWLIEYAGHFFFSPVDETTGKTVQNATGPDFPLNRLLNKSKYPPHRFRSE